MLEAFKKFILEKNLFLSSQKILLAVSGGVDSIVMLELFHRTGFKAGIAHCNFNLRGKESDEDQAFVQTLAKKYKIPVHIKSFNTKEFAEAKGISLQMSARELRYQWFEEIRKKNKYTAISTAHHKDDLAETMLINLVRGTGIAGLHGILPKQGNIIRPLLFASRKDILQFAKTNKLIFREDSSNICEKYMRNNIRHSVIPLLKRINPSLEDTLADTAQRIKEVEDVFQQAVNNQKDKIIKKEGASAYIHLNKLKKLNPLFPYLFAFLKEYSFNADTVNQILKSLDAAPGKVFYSPTHRLLKDRNFLIVSKKPRRSTSQAYSVPLEEGIMKTPLEISFKVKRYTKQFTIPKEKNSACLDYDKLISPLVLRRWKEGDFFFPLGMKNKKKLSDFFIDNKLSLQEKENIWLLTSGKDIIWVVGHRIDERYKTTDQTKAVFIAELHEFPYF